MQHHLTSVAAGHCANRLGLHCHLTFATANEMTWLILGVIALAVIAVGKKILFS
jgi:hypothetical protein